MEGSTPSSDEEVMMIAVEKVGKKLLARVPGDNNQVVLTCQLDTAASCNVMSTRDYWKLGNPLKTQSKTSLSMYNGSVRESMGRCVIRVMNREGQLSELEFEILDTKHHTLLSLDTCLNLQLLSLMQNVYV